MLPLIIMGSVLLMLHLHTLNERRQMLVDSVVRAAASNLDQMLDVRLSGLALLGRMLQESALSMDGELNPQRAHDLCMEYRRLHQSDVLIGTAQGEMLVNTRVAFGQRLPPLPEVHHELAVRMAVNGRAMTVSDPFIGPLAGLPMVTLSVPLQRRQQPALTLASAVEIAQLQQRMIKAFNLPEGWVVRLYTRTGNEVFRIPELAPEEQRHHAARAPWSTASLTLAPWAVSLMAPPVSPLDDGVVRAMLLVGTLVATIGLAYGGALAAASRLTRAMKTITHDTDGQVPTADIQEVAQIKAQLHRLDHDRMAAQELERRRIGLELHDDLQQKLALIRQDLASQPPDAGRDRQLAWVDESIASTRRLMLDLRPPALQEVGLPAALEALALQHQTTHRQSAEVSATEDVPWCELAEESAVALYRVAQEGLNNIRKHAQAQAIHINLSGLPGGEIVLEIADDGVGFDFDIRPRLAGYGLRGMQERLQALGGRLEVLSKPGAGTALVAHLPWPLTHAPEG